MHAERRGHIAKVCCGNTTMCATKVREEIDAQGRSAGMKCMQQNKDCLQYPHRKILP